MLKSVFALSVLLLSMTATAHSYWVDERASQLAIILGESGDDLRYDAKVVKRVLGFDEKNQPVAVKTLSTPNNVLLNVPDKTHTLISLFHPAYYSQDKQDNWHAKPKNEVKEAVHATAYINSNITLLDHYQKTVVQPEMALQIVPLADPFTLKIGDNLPVRVYYQGKPLAGAKVVPDYVNNADETLTTNQQGEAVITLKSAGVTVMNVHHEVENHDKRLADKTYYNSTLSFNLFKHHHD